MAKKIIDQETTKIARSKTLQSKVFNEKDYEINDAFQAGESLGDVHTCAEMMRELVKNKDVEIDARVLAVNKEGRIGIKKMRKKEFLEHFEKNKRKTFKEAFDAFLNDDNLGGSGIIGQDFLPLIGGPFFKQLYPRDYIRMHSAAFFAYHHDPLAKHIIHMMRDFTMGRGFGIDIPTSDLHLAQWRAFEDANDFYSLMDQFVEELGIYGEQMIWFLPNNQTKITYHLAPTQVPPKGAIPRIRLIDPSVMWDIVTYPEDITRVLYYQWVAPTQYQTYTGRDEGATVGTSKFIFQQIPGDQIIHVKINSVSNEKRGRSDLFPILGYLKRLRDTVNYSIVALQKAAAWSMDTTIEGSQTDIDAYVQDQQNLGTVAPAGSEFVHTSKITRDYKGSKSEGGKDHPAFEWTLSMIAAGSGFPISYLNTHLSGGGTRATAIVSTEPIAKKIESRQLVVERVVKKIAARYFEMIGLPPVDIEVTFPEVTTQDRSAKMKDISLAEAMRWISHDRASTMAAKELNITEFDSAKEQEEIKKETPSELAVQSTTNPLTAPSVPFADQPQTAPGAAISDQPSKSTSAITSDEKKGLNDAR